ncbi:SDR family NAD(P)-dependent oxidoreductase [Salinisphaera sp. SPP-AMP-43]|uniref:SDR family NAD(P)-dependent oxidoreductase n=1 Tax=Salinisphaera sp. SPP-AMP-43 TaxID=3121288 RepID=UPI003C6DEE0B
MAWGLAAAHRLDEQGYSVVLHARSWARADSIHAPTAQTAGCIAGGLSCAADIRSVAEQSHAFGRFDAIINNAGVMSLPGRAPTPDDHVAVMAGDVLAPRS